MLNSLDQGIFSTNYGAWSGTLHTVIYYPAQLKAGLTLGGPLPFIFDFKKWLLGDNFHVKRINGQLDSNIPFVQMT